MLGRRTMGFTLIEMLVVITMISLFATIAVPGFLDLLDRRRITSAAEAMASQVRQARAISRESSTIVGMSFSGSGDSWCFGLTDNRNLSCNCELTDVSAANSCQVPVSIRYSQASGETSTEREIARADSALYPGVELVASPSAIGFEPLRGLRLGNLAETQIILRSPRGLEARVAVNEVGRVAVCSPEGSTRVIGLRECI